MNIDPLTTAIIAILFALVFAAIQLAITASRRGRTTAATPIGATGRHPANILGFQCSESPAAPPAANRPQRRS